MRSGCPMEASTWSVESPILIVTGAAGCAGSTGCTGCGTICSLGGDAAAPASPPSEQIVPQPVQPVEPAQPAAPVTIKMGDSTDQVLASMGQPDRIAKVANKEIYFYKDMK